jgi:Ger(x)C family germination protein
MWRKKVLIIFLIAFVFLFPSASVRPAQMLDKTVFVSIGIDKVDTQYIISGTIIVNDFSSTGDKSTKTISATANSVNACIQQIVANQGRKVSLAHCNLVLIGAGLKDENMTQILSYFIKKYEMSNNALLVFTSDDVKAIQESSIENPTNAPAGLLETVASHNQRKVFGRAVTLDAFYKDYLRKSSTSLMGTVQLQDETITNPRTAAAFKNGKHIKTLSPVETSAMGTLSGNNAPSNYVLDIDGSSAVLSVKGKKCCIKTSMRGGFPHVSIHVDISAKVNDFTTVLDIDDLSDAVRDKIKAALEQRIWDDIAELATTMRANKIDPIGLFDTFYRRHNSAVKNYLRDKTVDDFLREMTFEKIQVNVSI